MYRRGRKREKANRSPGPYVWLEAVDNHCLVRGKHGQALLEFLLKLNSLCSGLLLSALETSIIATALVSISSSLGRYDKANWVVTAYLITYTGMYTLGCKSRLWNERWFDLYANLEVPCKASSSSLPASATFLAGK